MESAQLRQVVSKHRLSGSFVSLHAHRRRSHGAFVATWIPTRVLHVLLCQRPQRRPLSAGNRASVGQLFGSRLRLEDDSGFARRPKRFSAISPHYPRTRKFFPIQSVRRYSHSHAYLHTVRFPSVVRLARTHPTESDRSFPRPWGQPTKNFSSGHPSSFSSSLAGWGYICLFACPRRFSGAAPRRWPFQHHGCHHRAKPFRHSL